MIHCVKEVQCLLSALTFLQRCCQGLSMTACENAYNQPAISKKHTEELQEDLVLLHQFSAITAAAHGFLVADHYCALAELRRLSNTTFVSTHDESSPACLEQAMSEGHVAAIDMMMSCGASPRQQGSTWASCLRAATASFVPAKAALIHRLLRQKATFEVTLQQGKGWRRQCLLCMRCSCPADAADRSPPELAEELLGMCKICYARFRGSCMYISHLLSVMEARTLWQNRIKTAVEQSRPGMLINS